MNCPNCGVQNSDNAKYCFECGVGLHKLSAQNLSASVAYFGPDSAKINLGSSDKIRLGRYNSERQTNKDNMRFQQRTYDEKFYADFVLDNLEQGVAVFSTALDLLYHNHQMVYLCERFTNENIKKNLDVIHLPKELTDALQEFKNTYELEKIARVVLRISSKDKREFFLIIKLSIYAGKSYFITNFHEKRLRSEELKKNLKSSYSITAQEFKIIILIRKGFKDTEIAEMLKVKPCTIRTHIRNIYKKTSSSNRAELIAFIDDLIP